MRIYLIKKPVFIRERYEAYDKAKNVRYTAKGKVFSWGKKLRLFDRDGAECAFIRQKLPFLRSRFLISRDGTEIAEVVKSALLLDPAYKVKGLGWWTEEGFRKKEGSVVYEYRMTDGTNTLMTLHKIRMLRGAAYELDLSPDADEVTLLAVALAIAAGF